MKPHGWKFRGETLPCGCYAFAQGDASHWFDAAGWISYCGRDHAPDMERMKQKIMEDYR